MDVVTINLWGGNGPVRRRMAELGAWLRATRPDLVLLQEVEEVDGAGQADLLAASAAYPHVDGIATSGRLPGGEGLAVLSRHPLEPASPQRLPLAVADHPRALQRAAVRTPLGVVVLGNTHLTWRLEAGRARERQAEAVVRALSAADRPAILGGDLNDVPGSAALDVLDKAGFTDCCGDVGVPRPTFDDANGFMWQHDLAGRRVDHLLVRGLTLGEVRVVLDGDDGPVVSDHYGVWARVRPLDVVP